MEIHQTLLAAHLAGADRSRWSWNVSRRSERFPRVRPMLLRNYSRSFHGQFVQTIPFHRRGTRTSTCSRYGIEKTTFRRKPSSPTISASSVRIIHVPTPLFPELLSSKIFPDRDLCLRLTTNDPSKLPSIQAIAMEIEDVACKQFHQIEVGLENDRKSYEKMDFILVVDDFFSDEREKYFDGLIAAKARLKQTHDEANLFDDERPPFVPEKMKFDEQKAFHYYQTLAQQIQSSVKPTCRILLACANSIMIAAHAFIHTIRNVPATNIIGLSRMIENQAKARIGKRLRVDIKSKRKGRRDWLWMMVFRYRGSAYSRGSQRRIYYRHQYVPSDWLWRSNLGPDISPQFSGNASGF